MRFFLYFFFIDLFSVEKIELFLGFHCLYCNECLELVRRYMDSNPDVVVEIYILLNEKDERSLYLISYVDDFECFYMLMKYRFNKCLFFEFVKKKCLKIDKNALKKIKKHQKIFKKNNINGVPTWSADGVLYEGILDDMLTILRVF